MTRSLRMGMGFVMVAGMVVSSVAFAQEVKEVEQEMDLQDMMCERMQGKGPMGGPKMFGRMHPQIAASSDGGVVVLLGNKLVKYDKNLNIVKEVEIQDDMDAMMGSMMGGMDRRAMEKDCPLMKKDGDQAVEAKK